MLAFNRDAGVVLAGDLGATHSRVAVTDLAGEVMAQDVHDIAVAEGPDVVLTWLEQTFDRLLLEIGRASEDVRGVGVGLPGPVEFAAGRPVSPPIMPGWNLYPVGERLGERFSAPALVDNDVNIMALGEYWSNWRDEEFLLFVKIGSGIGSGIVTHGRVHRGADGAAGDIGHIHLPDHDDVICRCGNLGCLEAIAGGAALATQLRDLGVDAEYRSGCRRTGAARPARCCSTDPPSGTRHRGGAGDVCQHAQPRRHRHRRRLGRSR